MVSSPNAPFASAVVPSRKAECSRHVVVISCPSSRIAGRITKNCDNSTEFENPVPREICPGLLNSIEVFLSLERCPFLDARSNKSEEVSCLVSFFLIKNFCERLRLAFKEMFQKKTFTSFSKVPSQDCSVESELID